MNPFQEKAKDIEKTYKSWKSINVRPYDKETVDPYTRVRVILMNGTEFEAIWNTSRLSRRCTNNDVRRGMALIRRGEQQQQKRIASLKPINESILEHTIGYEQLAVDLTAILAQREKNAYVKKQMDFALLEDFDHLYRYADLLDFERGIHAEKLVGAYTEIMPGRPTVAEARAPQDDVRFYINNFLNDPITRLNIAIVTAAEQQTMNYYLNVANLHDTELGRKLYSEIAMIEEQHVTGYGSLSDPSPDMFECMVMHEYTECYLYWSCYNDEKDERIKQIWLMHFEEELSHLKFAAQMLEKYNGKVPASIDELIKFKGVGRKTANLVMAKGFQIPAICVDVHVHRISNRLQLVHTKTPDETEMALRKLLPEKYWLDINTILVTFGQNICKPIKPLCNECPIKDYCPEFQN